MENTEKSDSFLSIPNSIFVSTQSEAPKRVRKRNGDVVSFEEEKIREAIEKAFQAEAQLKDVMELRPKLQISVNEVFADVLKQLADNKEIIDLEQIQDQVEAVLMKLGYYSVAKRYVIYRSERAKARALRNVGKLAISQLHFGLLDRSLLLSEYDGSYFFHLLEDACQGLDASAQQIAEEFAGQLYPGITEQDIYRLLVLVARSHIEYSPDYAQVASRLLLFSIYREVFQGKLAEVARADYFFSEVQRNNFSGYIQKGINTRRVSEELASFDLPLLATALKPERDELFRYMGIQTLYDRYLLHDQGKKIESPQYFWMRVAMGLAVCEPDKNSRAIEFYNVMSTFRFVPSTPTLFNSGTLHPQLSSCFLTTVGDDLAEIFKGIGDNAKLSKWAGGLGNDWTNVRGLGAYIQGTNGESQGVVPFLKVANDTAVAVNQGGKRQGAVCAYLETWHLDIEEFLELRKNTGDDRRRTHDMNTAHWIPDLFLKRVKAGTTWTLFSPNEVPDLHDLYGKAFEERYLAYEEQAKAGKLRQSKEISAQELWRKMLSMLYETGHPWITFKDPSNIRSMQDHVGVVHSSNLCTEILLNTSKDETAVCNLGSINLVVHFEDMVLNPSLLQTTVVTAVRMLDNVIDINYYPTPEAKTSNSRHRPIGLGIMGFQDALYLQNLSYAKEEAAKFADESMEQIAYFAYLASAELARERGSYQSYPGSKWDRGLFPFDTIEILQNERGEPVDLNRDSSFDWEPVRKAVKEHGMRNSHVLAIAPTATISNIAGVSPSIEPTFSNLYVKANISGDFTSFNSFLVQELKQLGLWDERMVEELKYHDGSVQDIARIPLELKERYLTAFEISAEQLIECASRRQKWIDMGQSLNLYVGSRSGKALDDMYMLAWRKGLKTTYYLRSRGATQIEKSTIDLNRHGIQPKWMKNKSASSEIEIARATSCSVNDLECEVCQ